jgi:hypothetical protein
LHPEWYHYKKGGVNMTTEIYLWLESRMGIPYNFEDDISLLSTDIIAMDPATWSLTIYNIISLTKDAIDAVDEYDDQIPPDFPSARKIKSLIAEYTRDSLRRVIRTAFLTLGLVVPDEIADAKLTTIRNITAAFNDLVIKLSEEPVDKINKTDWFDKYDEDHNNVFTDDICIAKQDLINIQVAITGIREFHEETDEE